MNDRQKSPEMLTEVIFERPYCAFCGKEIDKWKTEAEGNHRIYLCPYCNEWNARLPTFFGIPVVLDPTMPKSSIAIGYLTRASRRFII